MSQNSMKQQLCEMTVTDLVTLLGQLQAPAFHAKQIFDWMYNKLTFSWDQMTNLGQDLRNRLKSHVTLTSIQLVRIQESADLQTYKFLWKLHDGQLVESVLICSGARRTLCVSSQVGCPAKCAFCASGKQGFMRNLRAAEIVEQFLHVQKWLQERGERISHIVYMGMGEPFKNYDHVVRSIRLLVDPALANLSQRRITLSTVGIVEGIRRFTQEGLQVNLVLSLHAPNQHIRKKIIPYARKYPLDEIIQAMQEYSQKTKRDITYEYILIAGINDDPEHAFELAHLLKGQQCTVNLIPYNPVEGVRLKRPEKKVIKQFRSVLYGSKIVNTCRFTKGVDIAAACGQLAMQKKEEMAV